MSSARCLNWSRPPPGRHPALRKQVSCSEPSPPSSSSSSSSSAYSPPSLAQPHHPVRTPGPEADFCHQFLVTGAIIHANRFQTYHTYDQARRGGSASLVRPRTHESPHRPASASVGQRTPVPRGVLCKQLSLDQSILGQSSFPAATVASGAGGAGGGGGGGMVPVGGEHPGVEAALLAGDGERAGWNGLNRKQQRVAAGSKTDGTDLAGGKKALKPGGGVAGGKDSRINIKIFLGQTVQQDSSDTGVSDTEGTGPGGASNGNSGLPPKPPGGPTPPANVPTETSASYTAGKPKAPNGNAPGGINATPSSASSNGQQQPHSGTGSNGVPAGGIGPAPNAGSNASGRNSSLAQRRAQFQANRQNSEAHDRRQPPLVRALSAPIRPADPDTARFLQGKKKPRRRKVLREKDEYNICEEDEFSDDADCKASAGGAGPSTFVGAAAAAAAAAAAGKPFPPGLPLRSRSVLGGAACDIETLVSLLSSGGSDSEKEQEPAPASSPSPTAGTVRQQQHLQQFPSAVHLPAKGRAPMLKKAGKSVSFQETDLKPAVGTAGLNRDYRKPSFQSAVANRMRRTQQLVSTLNAFQLKDKDRDKGGDKDSGEERYDRASSGIGTDGTSSAETLPTGLTSSSTSSSKTESSKAATAGAGATATNGDLQTPKEQECYRLFLKMSKKGLAVSYDTILRGMLTPTELRVLQKKKSREQQRNGSEPGDTAETPSPENGPGFDGGAEAMAFEEIRGLKELHFDRNAQATQDAGQAPVQLQAADPALGDGKKSEPEDEENTS